MFIQENSIIILYHVVTMHKIDLSLLRMYYVYQERQLVHLCVTAGKFWYRKLHMVLAFITSHTNGLTFTEFICQRLRRLSKFGPGNVSCKMVIVKISRFWERHLSYGEIIEKLSGLSPENIYHLREFIPELLHFLSSCRWKNIPNI